MKYILFSTIVFFSLHLFGQTGINTEIVNSKAEFEVVCTTHDKGVLIPRMLTADTALITSPAIGLLIYSTNDKAFYYCTGTAWTKIGQSCLIVEDTDGDTKIEVDNGSDNDEIQISAKGIQAVTITKTGLTQNVGNLQKPAGTITINKDYTLPMVDGNANDILITDGNGVLTWEDPLSLPGLVAGLQTIPLVTGREMEWLSDKGWYIATIPWSNITIEKISFYINVVDLTKPTTIEVGLYDGTSLLVSDSVTFTTTGFQFGTVHFATPFDLEAGKLYRIGVVDRYKSNSEFLENPNYTSVLHWKTVFSTIPQILPTTISSYSTGRKPIWLCLY